MRVLLVSHAEWSHAAGLVPLGWGLRAAGHEVLVATQPELAGKLLAGGLPVVAVGRDHRIGEVLHRLSGTRRRGRGLEDFYDGTGQPWPQLVWSYRYVVQWWWRLLNEPMLPDLVALCRQWEPDLVVWETTTFAGAVAARATGTPHVRFVWSADLFGRMRERFLAARDAQPADQQVDPVADWLAGCAARSGTDFAEELVTGQATITHLPASLRTGDPAGIRYLPVRYVPYNGPALLPGWLREPPARPRVCVTLGTSAIERFGRYACSLADLLAALADLEVEVVATVPESERAGLGVVPGNVRLESFVPLDALLPTCAVVVNHGGPGTVGTAVVHAVPQLVVPAEFDAPVLARLLAGTGAGIALGPSRADPVTVRAAVAALLTDPAYRAAAVRLRDEAAAAPDPYQLGVDLAAGLAADLPVDVAADLADLAAELPPELTDPTAAAPVPPPVPPALPGAAATAPNGA